MTALQKIVFHGVPTSTAIGSYVGSVGEFILDSSTGQILYQDGSTPGGITVGSSGGTTFTGVTITLETDPPNDSINAGYIVASGGTSDMDIVVSPIGAGAFALVLADGTSNGGNKRGNWASDLQVFQSGKNSPTQVASGQHAFAANAGNTASGYCSVALGLLTVASNEASYAEGQSTVSSGESSHAEGFGTTASSTTSHAEGEFTTASGPWSHAEGYNTTASNDYCHAEGNNTTASASAAHAEGSQTTASNSYCHAEGFNTLADGNVSQATGQDSWTRGISFYQAYSTGDFNTRGDQQAGRLLLKNSTTDATPIALTSDGQDASTDNQFVLPTGSAMAFTGSVVAASTGGDAIMFTFTALLKNISGTTSVVGSPTVTAVYSDTGAESWAVAISADTGNNALAVVATGADSTTIYWTAEVHSQELVTL